MSKAITPDSEEGQSAYRLAMIVLQSPAYHLDPEARDVVDHVLSWSAPWIVDSLKKQDPDLQDRVEAAEHAAGWDPNP